MLDDVHYKAYRIHGFLCDFVQQKYHCKCYLNYTTDQDNSLQNDIGHGYFLCHVSEWRPPPSVIVVVIPLDVPRNALPVTSVTLPCDCQRLLYLLSLSS